MKSSTAESQRDRMLKAGYVTASDAAARVGVNVATIYRMMHTGKVEVISVGQLNYIYIPSLATHYKQAPPIYNAIMDGVDETQLRPSADNGNPSV